MKRLLLIPLFLISCTKTPSFTEGRYESKQSALIEINARVSRDRTLSVPIPIDSGVVFVAYNNCDTSDRIVSFGVESWRGVVDQEDLIAKVMTLAGVESVLSDIVVTMPRRKAEQILRELD